ncbi:MAG: cytochrome c biogenesis protein ResB [Deltaproteobacteria bacterium]|nr:cytochrome c biogenesis protein ResB [Deltaproteobacteria bacterium]
MTKKKQGNIVWNFFASVKLALFTLFTLAATSIIGTIIPQNEMASHYVHLYGQTTARIFQILSITNMYQSWWFRALLILFSTNLTICTIERLPNIWRVVTLDNLSTSISRLQKMAIRRVFKSGVNQEQTGLAVQKIMHQAGWQADQRARDEGTLFFSQKGAWTRLGVIMVHTSILTIFVGALIGKLYGFKAGVMLPEGSSTNIVYKSSGDHSPIPLGFTLRCNAFNLSYYDTGMPKEYRSDLTVSKNGKDLLSKSIVVNDPLQFGGLTFYQSSFQAIPGQFAASLTSKSTGAKQKFFLRYPTERARLWPAEKVRFGITDIAGPNMRQKYRYKIWFSDGKGSPSTFWIDQNHPVKIERPGNNYLLLVKPRFATGLQIAKDPGVWVVYIGCIMMILGLIIIFFMSHRRIWALVSENEGESSILLCGTSNKDKVGFEKVMTSLYKGFADSQFLRGEKHE